MLPSQSVRPKSSRSHMYRRTRRKLWPIAIGLLIVVSGGFVVLKGWSASRGSKQANSTQQPAAGQPNTPKTAEPAKPNLLAAAIDPGSVKAPVGPPSLTPPSSIPKPPPQSNVPAKAAEKPAAEKISMAAAPQTPPASKTPASVSANPAAAPVGNATGASGGANGGGASQSPPAKQQPVIRPSAEKATADSSSAKDATDAGSTTFQRLTPRLQAGLDLLAQNKPVEARKMLSAVLETSGLSAADADRARIELTKVNQRLVFGTEVVAGDPFAGSYVVESGDHLSKLPRKLGVQTEYQFLMRLNKIENERRLRAGQKLKTIKGPFHAVVDKSAYRMDLYLGDGAERVYVRSFKVGLGEHDGTPEGAFTVKSSSKLINPAWTNPRTGESFQANDPKNPLGEYWIGLVGISDNIRGLQGYGIHGTIEPDSIGQMRSMGCVRMLHDDIALVYELLMEGVSRVEIRGADYP